MSSASLTPRKQGSQQPSPSAGAAQASRSHIVHASPHYTTSRRHSLYGTEDRVILDPGSRIWKVGFSGEGKPRDVFYAGGENARPLWTLNRATNPTDREEEDRLLEARLQSCLRSVFHESLLTDPKSRKVILIEHPLLPLHIKDAFARILFNNLQVPSISFACSHLLALMAAGRLTGLVLDCGHLESTVLPIYSSRPLFHNLRTTPLAGARLSSHLRALLLMFGTYLPPPTSLSASVNVPSANRSTRVPEEVLTDAVIEELKTRICFVGDILDTDSRSSAFSPTREPGSEMEVTSDAAMSESEFTRLSREDVESNFSSQHAASSSYSVVSHSRASVPEHPQLSESHLQGLANLYTRHSTATDLRIRVEPPPSQQIGTGGGTLIVPGWIRERAAEVLFEGGDVDESSVAEVILDALLKVPVDLRKSLASAILVVGGTPMLPGFIPRLHAELIRAISTPPATSTSPHASSGVRASGYDRYGPLRQLVPYISILNHPAPPPPLSTRASENAGKAPAFTPACMAWVGGSLAGALKTGGVEVAREKWDEADSQADLEEDAFFAPQTPRPSHAILPDWTRSLLPAGAPPAKSTQQVETPTALTGASTTVSVGA